MQILVYTLSKCIELSNNASFVQSMQSKKCITRNAYLKTLREKLDKRLTLCYNRCVAG